MFAIIKGYSPGGAGGIQFDRSGKKRTATTRYSLYGLNLNIVAPVKLNRIGRFAPAINIRPMFPSVVDQFSIGGRYTVRGLMTDVQTLQKWDVIHNEADVT